jgi:hypothetical protein
MGLGAVRHSCHVAGFTRFLSTSTLLSAHVSRCTALCHTTVCGCLQLKTQFPEVFKAPELAVPPKHTLAVLGGAAQHKELLDRWVAAAEEECVLQGTYKQLRCNGTP